jgi:hypothetical protein
MSRLNQTEPATFSILPRWAFFRDSVFIYFNFFTNQTVDDMFFSDMTSIRSRFKLIFIANELRQSTVKETTFHESLVGHIPLVVEKIKYNQYCVLPFGHNRVRKTGSR